jgi:TPR repeat protein
MAAMTVPEDEQLAARAMEAGAYEEAACLLQPLVERNSEYALLTLGWIYETGAAGTLDKHAARLYYEHAAAEGSASAYLRLGWLLLDNGEEMQARATFEAGVQLDNDECKSALAQLNDEGVERLAAQAMETKAYEEAVRLLQPLAERNSGYALLLLGWIYDTGATGASDKDAARSYYERAAAEGSTGAYLGHGQFLQAQGEESQARAAFEAGAERGDIRCMSRLGRMMLEARGGPIDVAAGSAWLKKAAEQGHIFAQRELLSIEGRNAQSILKKLSVIMKTAWLAIKGVRQIWKDPHSDRVR